MPKGDRYQIKKWDKGPKSDVKKRNSHVDILQDVADRVLDLEKETAAAAGAKTALVAFNVNGRPGAGVPLFSTTPYAL